MRVLLAAAVIALGSTAARAADFGWQSGYHEFGYRSAPLVIYDYQSGVTIRPYWLEPWGYRHYFPATGKRPRVGRHENLRAPSHPSKPAQTFQRSWSNMWAFVDELPRAPLNPRPAPRAK